MDFDYGGLHIRKQITYDEQGRPVEASLKTESSEGFVPMPHWYMAELTTFKKSWNATRLKLGEKWSGSEKQYLFHNGFGEKIFPSTPTHRWIKFLAKHDLPRIRLHDLRHTAAMLLREQGVDLKTIQERLRHSRMSITADFYAHESAQVSREAAEKLERMDPQKLVRPQSVPKKAK